MRSLSFVISFLFLGISQIGAQPHPICTAMVPNLTVRPFSPGLIDLPQSDYLFERAIFRPRDNSLVAKPYSENDLAAIVSGLSEEVFRWMGKPYPFQGGFQGSTTDRVAGEVGKAGWFYVRTDWQIGHDSYQRHGFGLLMQVDPTQTHPVLLIRPTFAYPQIVESGAALPDHPGGYPAARSVRALQASLAAASLEIGNLLITREKGQSASGTELPKTLDGFAQTISSEEVYRPSQLSVKSDGPRKEHIERRFSFNWGSTETLGVNSVTTYKRDREGRFRFLRITMGDFSQAKPQEFELAEDEVPSAIKLVAESLRRLIREEGFEGEFEIKGPQRGSNGDLTYAALLPAREGSTKQNGFMFVVQTKQVPFLNEVWVLKP